MKTFGTEKLSSVSNFSHNFDSHVQSFMRKLFSSLTLFCPKVWIRLLKYFDRCYKTTNIISHVVYIRGVVEVMNVLFHEDFHKNKLL